MRHHARYLILYTSLACGVAACSERTPSVPLRSEVPSTPSASLNGGSPTSADSEAVQSGLCAFDVLMQVNGKGKMLVVGKGQSITLFTAPTLEVTITNLGDPEKQLSFGITGAFHVTTDADGNSVYVITGRNLVHNAAAGLFLTQGVFRYSLDASGNLVQPVSGRGQMTDLCALLS